MRKRNRVVEFFALAAVVLGGHPDTALAATLNFSTTTGASANTLPISINGPGGTNSAMVAVTTPGTLGTLTVANVYTSDGTNWLCANPGAGSLTVNIGTLCTGGNTSQLINVSYNGAIVVNDSNGNSGTLYVILSVSSGGGATGLAASQNPVIFNVPAGSGSQQQAVGITFNGVPQPIDSVTSASNSFQGWLQASIQGTSVLITVNPSALTGNDSGTVTLSTSNGALSIQVILTVGGSGTPGLAANPNPLILTVPIGSTVTQGQVNITYNGALTPISSVSTVGQPSWLSASTASAGVVTVTANPTGLSGNYSGSVTVNTVSNGQITFQVNFNVVSGLAASPNPITWNVPFGSATLMQQVNITYKGAPISFTSNPSVSTGQSWLQASNSGNGIVTVMANPSGLSGSYFGTVTVFTTVGPTSFSVNLTVGPGSLSGLVASPSTVNFNIPIAGSGTTSQNVAITFNGLPVPIQSVSNITQQPWVLLNLNSATGIISVGINGASLSVGSYSAQIGITTASGVVNFQVNVGVGPIMTLSPTSLSFAYAVGQAQPPSQSVTISPTGAGQTTFIATASTSAISITPTSGTVGAGIAPSSLTVNVNPTGLTAGTYTGAITVTGGGGSQTINVSLTVRPPGAVLTASSFLNAAFTPGSGGLPGLVPCGLATVTGLGLASNLQGLVSGVSSFGPLPYTLNGVSITVSGIPAPIESVANQNGVQSVNFQTPCEVQPGSATVVVQVGSDSTTVSGVTIFAAQPGVFNYQGPSGKAYAAVTRAADGSYVTPSNFARRGETYYVMVTGLGQVTPPALTNSAGAGQSVVLPVIVGVNYAPVPVVSAQYLSGSIGAYMVGFQIPINTASGPDQPLAIALVVNGQVVSINQTLLAGIN